jgi:hypothetical protein
MLKEFKRLFYSILTLVIIFSFQNCGIQSSVNQNVSTSSKQESGNGGGYEGKPDGIFYRYVPGYTCEGTFAAEQITEITNGNARLYDNKKNQCGSADASTTISNLDISPFQNEFISVNDYLFKRYDEKPDGIPSRLAEVLCRDDFVNPTIEIVSHYDRDTNEALSRIYLKSKQISDFSVSRLLSSTDVKYVATDLSFSVDFSKPIQMSRKFTGTLISSSVAGLKSGPLVCVVGGSLDTSNWALKTLTTMDSNGFQVLKNGDVLLFSDISRNYFFQNFYTSVAHIFRVTVGGIISDFSKAILGDDLSVIYSGTTNSDDLIAFYGQRTTEGWPSLYVYDSRNSKTKRLTNLISGGKPEEYEFSHPVLTNDQYLIYDTQIVNYLGQNNMVIRVFDLNSDSIQNLDEISGRPYGYVVLPNINQVIIFEKDSVSGVSFLKIFDVKLKTNRQLNLQIPGNCYIRSNFAQGILDNSEIIANQICDQQVHAGVRISLTTGNVKFLNSSDSQITWVSSNKKWVVLTDSKKANSIYNIETNKLISIPVDPNFAAFDSTNESNSNFLESQDRSKISLINNQLLYGLGGYSDSPTMYQVDLVSGRSVSICKEAIGKKLFIGSISEQKVFLFTYDQTLKVFRFYQAKNENECPRINEFPSDSAFVPTLIPTSIGFGLVMSDASSVQTGKIGTAAVFVPIDGRPPLKFNSDTSHHWSMSISSDRNRIYLQGPGKNDTSNVFSFDLN